jgi:hypothetical protein
MLFYARRGALLAATVLLAACDGASTNLTEPTAPLAPTAASASVDRVIDEQRVIDMTGTLVGFECDDGTETELVELEGTIVRREVTTITPSGAIIFTSHSRPMGLRGTGTVSGHEYRVVEKEHYAVSQREPGYAGTFRIVYELTNRVTMKTYKIVEAGHYTVAENGTVVVEREKIRGECGS